MNNELQGKLKRKEKKRTLLASMYLKLIVKQKSFLIYVSCTKQNPSDARNKYLHITLKIK